MEYIQGSDEIIYGKILSTSSQWNADRTHIETTAQIQVADAFKNTDKGVSSGSIVPVTVRGGTVGDVTEWVEDTPVFVPNTDVFVTLGKSSDGKYSVYGLDHGIHIVNIDKKGKSQTTSHSSSANEVEIIKGRINEILEGGSTQNTSTNIFGTSPNALDSPELSANSPTITSVTPDTSSAGTDSIITITGTGFGTKASRESMADVAFLYKLKTDGTLNVIYATGWDYYSYNANDIVTWTDTEIKVKVPTGITHDGYPGSACSGYLKILTDASTQSGPVPFTVTFGYGKKKWNSPATYYVNPGTVSGAAAAIQNAGTTWNNAIPSSSFRLNYGGTSTKTTFGNDGTSLIYYGPESDFAPNQDSIIAWASSWSSGGFITEADVEFNTHWTWTTGSASGSQMNIETIVLHEMGHWLFLKDLYGWLPEFNSAFSMYPSDLSPEKKVMFGYNGQSMGNQNLKTLSSADIAGIRWIYPASISRPVANFAGSPTSSNNPPLTVAFTDLSTNTPTSWSWSFGDGSASSTLQNPTHTYTSAGTYTVSLTVTNSAGSDTFTRTDYITVNPGSETYVFVTKWGSYGLSDGKFVSPSGIAVDSSGNVYVADNQNHRIQKFTSTGTFLGKWGSYGSGDGQFIYPTGMAVDSSGYIYVADEGNNRIQKFTSTGTFLGKWGSYGSGDGQFSGPSDVSIDSSNNIYVVSEHLIQKFTYSNVFSGKWGSQGSGDGQFYVPSGVDVDSSGNVYVADTNNHRIQKFSLSGLYLAKWGSRGSGDGQFNFPLGIAVDSLGNVFVVENANRVQKFTSTGTFITKWGSGGEGDGQFTSPAGIAVDSSGNVYVADTNNNRIQKFEAHAGSVKPVASFTGTPTSGFAPLTVAFTDSSINTPTSWSWSFGDGSSSSTLQNPS
ncbi:MAG: PKD domain-containing protein, partial [Methanoregula sp.]